MEHLQEISNVETARSPKKRDSNLELFRIITMMFIVAQHDVINWGLIGIDGLFFLKKSNRQPHPTHNEKKPRLH